MAKRAILALSISNKNMKSQKLQPLAALRHLRIRGVVAIVGLAAVGLTIIPVVRAATTQDLQKQIDNLSSQNDKKSDKVSDLQLQANNYQDAIDKLQGEIGAIQGAIAGSEAKQASLQQQIDTDQKKLDHEKKVLGEDLKAMYVDGDMSTVEMLATSKNLSDFVDAETYRGAVQSKIQNTMNEIATLQNQLKDQQEQVQQLLATQHQQEDRLSSDQATREHLLAMNKSQQDSYNKQIASNKKKINALQAEQARINAASSRTFATAGPSGGRGGNCDIGMGNGGYPLSWCNAGLDSLTVAGGFPNRECTSFAYWYFTTVEGKNLSVYGNAKDWVDTSSRPVSNTPHVGDIFVHTAGEFGHVGIVTGIDGGWVQTMSMNDGYDGNFYNNREYPISELYYIH